ncbi:zinc ribbon domain-containing protein [Spongiibacter nanhainus]|uniref:Zinc ribbon domain-containing protein n=1 Tax=Spongiibacter nanhainus TaxID=2794344 RepID=A0A7T4QZH0_9GAMM|nr:zinc ribbon domain-containing protein [Spongiibacter nanhainus]QQD17580.1 zinc ribbon domain-containing protein [Spongiibacter nanhainus]
MPIYEYACQACRHQLEALQKMSDPKLTTCPACGQETLVKKVSAAAFRLKGGGWYETDFKSGGKKKNLAGDSAPAGDSGGKSGGDKSGGEKSSTPSSSSSAGSS